jgi:phosphoribosyl 1,2-cyclic phosphodiesterase
MIEICAIASGSNGNCYYIGNEDEAILIDAGVSRKQVLLRMNEMGLDPQKVKAIFISHEHADHSRGVRVLAKALKIHAYMTKGTFESMWNPNRPGLYGLFEPGKELEFGAFKIHSFLKNHDAANPCSFRVEIEGKSIGVMTDIGKTCDNVESHFAKCHAVFIESNYDEEMLDNGVYPYPLKVRVKSDVGHLSNAQAVELLDVHAGEDLEHVILSHLSGENNTPELAYKTFEPFGDRYSIHLTSREAASGVIVM